MNSARCAVDRVLVAVRGQIDVVGEHDVDRIEAEALERELERAHHAVVGIVEALAARRRLEEGVRTRALVRLAELEQAADLGGDQEGVARLRRAEIR